MRRHVQLLLEDLKPFYKVLQDLAALLAYTNKRETSANANGNCGVRRAREVHRARAPTDLQYFNTEAVKSSCVYRAGTHIWWFLR